jgi:fructokinase
MAISEMRIGIDLGGTKIEALAIGGDGAELVRYRIDTPRDDYAGTVAAMAGLVRRIEAETGAIGSVGAGIPGTVSEKTGLVKNANSVWLNERPLQRDLSADLGREVRVANDANCLAVSEATDGAAAGERLVFGVIIGTGCGGGLAIDGRMHAGPNGIAGEWGHNPLPWAQDNEFPGPLCYCGRRGCLEMWISGTGLARDYVAGNGEPVTARAIMAAVDAGDRRAIEAFERYEGRLARGLAMLINAIDPDVLVFGGGMSKVERLYGDLPGLILPHIFGGEFDTRLLPARFGDSSGVRGAAWLWPAATR